MCCIIHTVCYVSLKNDFRLTLRHGVILSPRTVGRTLTRLPFYSLISCKHIQAYTRQLQTPTTMCELAATDLCELPSLDFTCVSSQPQTLRIFLIGKYMNTSDRLYGNISDNQVQEHLCQANIKTSLTCKNRNISDRLYGIISDSNIRTSLSGKYKKSDRHVLEQL